MLVITRPPRHSQGRGPPDICYLTLVIRSIGSQVGHCGTVYMYQNRSRNCWSYILIFQFLLLCLEPAPLMISIVNCSDYAGGWCVNLHVKCVGSRKQSGGRKQVYYRPNSRVCRHTGLILGTHRGGINIGLLAVKLDSNILHRETWSQSLKFKSFSQQRSINLKLLFN